MNSLLKKMVMVLSLTISVNASVKDSIAGVWENTGYYQVGADFAAEDSLYLYVNRGYKAYRIFKSNPNILAKIGDNINLFKLYHDTLFAMDVNRNIRYSIDHGASFKLIYTSSNDYIRWFDVNSSLLIICKNKNILFSKLFSAVFDSINLSAEISYLKVYDSTNIFAFGYDSVYIVNPKERTIKSKPYIKGSYWFNESWGRSVNQDGGILFVNDTILLKIDTLLNISIVGRIQNGGLCLNSTGDQVGSKNGLYNRTTGLWSYINSRINFLTNNYIVTEAGIFDLFGKDVSQGILSGPSSLSNFFRFSSDSVLGLQTNELSTGRCFSIVKSDLTLKKFTKTTLIEKFSGEAVLDSIDADNYFLIVSDTLFNYNIKTNALTTLARLPDYYDFLSFFKWGGTFALFTTNKNTYVYSDGIFSRINAISGLAYSLLKIARDSFIVSTSDGVFLVKPNLDVTKLKTDLLNPSIQVVFKQDEKVYLLHALRNTESKLFILIGDSLNFLMDTRQLNNNPGVSCLVQLEGNYVIGGNQGFLVLSSNLKQSYSLNNGLTFAWGSGTCNQWPTQPIILNNNLYTFTGANGILKFKRTIIIIDTGRAIKILQPTPSTVWEPGSTQKLIWETKGLINNVKIVLLSEKNIPIVLTESVINSNFYDFTIPAITGKYSIKVYNVMDTLVVGKSGFFTIGSTAIQVSSDKLTSKDISIFNNQVRFPMNITNPFHMKLLNCQGRLILNQEFLGGNVYDLDQLPGGIYYLLIKMNGKILLQKKIYSR